MAMVRISVTWVWFLVCVAAASVPTVASATSCPNEALRTGAAADLPDCRAYELVTPPSMDGRRIHTVDTGGTGRPYDMFPLELSTPSGNSYLYMTTGSPLTSPSEPNGFFDVYEAIRQPSGWQTARRLTLSGAARPSIALPGGVSSDHNFTFLNYLNVDYLSSSAGTLELTGVGDLGTDPYAQGRFISSGGQHVIFSTGHDPEQSIWCQVSSANCEVRQLEADAPPDGTGAVYDRSPGGPTRVISLLPGDIPPVAGNQTFYKGVSEDGEAVAFEISGNLYVRYHNEETLEISNDDAVFAGLSANGQYLFYVAPGRSGTIHRVDLNTGTDVEVDPAAADGELVNISKDGSHVYFISRDALTGSGKNGRDEVARTKAGGTGTLTEGSPTVTDVNTNEGSFEAGMIISGTGIPVQTTITGVGAGSLTLSNAATSAGAAVLSAGFPNLYVWTQSELQYITTVASSDLVQTSGIREGYPALTNWTEKVVSSGNLTDGEDEKGPGAGSSRTTADGKFLVFESRGELSGYNNDGHTAIYRYDAIEKSLLCISCSPNAPAATRDARLQASWINVPTVIHNLSENGSRVFFETAESLVGHDTDSVNDIYEWQVVAGTDPQLSLISTGESTEYRSVIEPEVPPDPNILLSITPDGGDIFFLTQDALSEDGGLGGVPAVYDARVLGGFPVQLQAECQEETCRPEAIHQAPPAGPASEGITEGKNVQAHKRHCHRRMKSVRVKKKRHFCGKRRNKNMARASIVEERAAGSAPADDAYVDQPSNASERQAAADLIGVSSGVLEAQTITSAIARVSTTAAAMHPDFDADLKLNFYLSNGGDPTSDTRTESVSVSLPPGLIGNPNAVARCDTGHFLAFDACPAETQVGIAKVLLQNFQRVTEPIYNLAPPHPSKEVARFGFYGGIAPFPVYINVKVRSASDYRVVASVQGAPSLYSLLEAQTTLWGNPTGSVHDKLRLTPEEAKFCNTACEEPEGKRVVERTNTAFVTNPSACGEGQVNFEVTSYQLPGDVVTASAPIEPGPITDCTGLPFSPSFEADPTSHEAGAPTGLRTKLVLPQHLGAEERATSTMREARVTLPAGMQVAAGAANWIDTCSDAQVGYHEEVDTACPDGSKLGTATFTSPALSVPIEGTIYQRAPEPGRQLGLWLTADALGLHIKLPGSLEPDKQTGRLTAVFTDLPQVPVEEIDLNVWGGPRAPLQNPDHCGTYTTDFTFSPHSNDPAATGQSTMQIDEGCNQPFDPTLHAGVTNPVAGKYSPFVFDLTRPDANQALRGFSLKLPDGELAKLKGVPLCSDADANAATCPQASRIGSIQATSGPGPEPFTLPEPGKPSPQIYLAAPYRGSPFSIVSEVPAQAGPFDLGVIAVRSGLTVEPETGQAVVKADPLPQFFEGVGIAYRNIHAVVDRPEFNLNPTDCREMAVSAEVTSTKGTVAHPAARFQVDGCKALKFKPRLSLRLRGGTKRADYPALTAVLKARKGDANIAATSVALPHSEFLAQEHIGTICTRVQFAADKCPKGSVYGKAKAITPLLDKSLAGPVYLRSSNHPLPDLVAKLGGQLEIDLVGRIDSVHGGIRTTFESVPDAPVTKFVLQMRGGKKGLLTNSTDICRGSHKATVQMKAQNGRAAKLRPVLASGGCGKKKLGKHTKHH